jgi:hypothetical protein
LTAGLLLGAAMKPDLTADDRPSGPQIVADEADVPPTGPFDDHVNYASYGGRMPDYVLGTDWAGRTTEPVPRTPHRRRAAAEPIIETPPLAPPPYGQTRVALPSGGPAAAYEDARRAEPPPPLAWGAWAPAPAPPPPDAWDGP